MKIKEHFMHSGHTVAVALACFAGISFSSCADDDFDNGGSNRGMTVSFNVSDVEDDALSAPVAGMSMTRSTFAGLLEPMNLTSDELTLQKLPAQGDDGNSCIIESTTAGIQAIQGAAATADGTRANITTIDQLGHFSSYGYKGTSASAMSATPDWFYNSDTNPDGTLVNPVYWKWTENHFGKFYAVYPQVTDGDTKIKMSPAGYGSTPYVDFEVEPNVKDQKDLMTACSGVVEYETENVAPTSSLKFRHALTAVRFKVGQNLSYNKHITKVEIVNALSKGKYTLSTNETGADATWTGQNTPATFTLSDLNVSTHQAVNQIIMGNDGDNYTFYMIPQTLTGNGVMVKIYFDGNNTTPGITATLTGSWKPGTTKTYALSQNTSTWDYQLTVTNPAAAAYDKDATLNYSITSYRKAPDGTQQPVSWKVVGYQESVDNGATWTTLSDTKPSWLTSLSMENGDGSTSAKQGVATITKDVVDHLARYNKVMQDATAKGADGNYWNLANANGAASVENTANSYLISAPGYYRIPLVYGNAITDGNKNEHAYKTNNTGTYILQNFKDHDGQDITDPWITETNNGVNAPDGVKIVWTDQSGIVTDLGLEGNGTNAFVHFRVPKDNLKNGNAVIAVTKGGTVVWSWHLWFDHSDALTTIPVVNYQNVSYKFAKSSLGFAYHKWEGSDKDEVRIARVKIEQTVANGGMKQFAYIDIKQKPGCVKEISSTIYQFGRKDAMPDVHAVSDGSFTENGGSNMSVQNGIQHPDVFYTSGTGWDNNYNQYNLWSMDNTVTGFNDNPVVKTIYDPCPAGFKMPASNAFTGFTKDGQNTKLSAKFNGTWDHGWIFNNKIENPDATVYFPASGVREHTDGSLGREDKASIYWTAMPYSAKEGCYLSSSQYFVGPLYKHTRAYGLSVHPVTEK